MQSILPPDPPIHNEKTGTTSFSENEDLPSSLYMDNENTMDIQPSFISEQPPDNPVYHNISMPAIGSLLDEIAVQQKYFSASKREQELNNELRVCKQQVVELQKKVNSLFLENEKLKNELELLRQNNNAGNEYNNKEKQNRYWTPTEHKRFLDALNLFGEKNKKAISIYVGTRNVRQIQSHLQKYKERLANMKIYGKPGCAEDSLLTLDSKILQSDEEMQNTALSHSMESIHQVIRFIKPLIQNQVNSVNVTNEGNNPFC